MTPATAYRYEIVSTLPLAVSDRKSVKTGTSAPVTIESLAEYVQIPVGFLRECGLNSIVENGRRSVAVPYRDEIGQTLAVKKRASLSGTPKYVWAIPGLSASLYGLERLEEAERQGFLVLVEGESDCWTLWYHGFPALGASGAGNAGKLEFDHIKRFRTIYIFQEPDAAGGKFVADASARLRALGYQGMVRVIRPRGNLKDPNELHRDDPARFRERFLEALERSAAVPIEGEPKEDAGRRNADESRKLTTALKGGGLDDPGLREVIRATWEAGSGRAVFSLNYQRIATAAGKSVRWVEEHLPRALDTLERAGLPLIRRTRLGRHNRHAKTYSPSCYDASLLREFLGRIEAARPVNISAYAVIGQEVAAKMRIESQISQDQARTASSKKPSTGPARPEDYAKAQMARLIEGVSERAITHAYGPAREKAALMASVSLLMARIEAIEAAEAEEEEAAMEAPDPVLEPAENVGSKTDEAKEGTAPGSGMTGLDCADGFNPVLEPAENVGSKTDEEGELEADGADIPDVGSYNSYSYTHIAAPDPVLEPADSVGSKTDEEEAAIQGADFQATLGPPASRSGAEASGVIAFPISPARCPVCDEWFDVCRCEGDFSP